AMIELAERVFRPFQAGVQFLHLPLRLLGLSAGFLPGGLQGGDVTFDDAELATAERAFLVQAFTPLPMLADAAAKIGCLRVQCLELFPRRIDSAVRLAESISQFRQGSLSIRDALIDGDELQAQLAQLALARDDAGLRVVPADGEHTIRLHDLT